MEFTHYYKGRVLDDFLDGHAVKKWQDDLSPLFKNGILESGVSNPEDRDEIIMRAATEINHDNFVEITKEEYEELLEAWLKVYNGE